jgi:hypothetical protein
MGLFDKLKQAFSGNTPLEGDPKFEQAILKAQREFANTGWYWSPDLNITGHWKDGVENWTPKEKISFIRWMVPLMRKEQEGRRTWSSNDPTILRFQVMLAYVSLIMKHNLPMEDEDAVQLYHAFRPRSDSSWSDLREWPMTELINQLLRQRKGKPITPGLQEFFTEIIGLLRRDHNYYSEKERLKLSEKLEAFLHAGKEGSDKIRPTHFKGDDRFATHANRMLEALPSELQAPLWALIAHAQKASGSKPSDKFLKEGKKLVDGLGAEHFRSLMHLWMQFLIDLKDESSPNHYNQIPYIANVNADAVKGLVWLLPMVQNEETLNLLSRLAIRTYTKQPGWLPPAPSLGNACIYALYASEGFEGIGKLSQLRLRIKYGSAEKLIDKYLAAAAEERSVSTDDIEDMSVDNHGLAIGNLQLAIGEFLVRLQIMKVGKVDIQWYRVDGTPQKSVPAAVKEHHAAELKAIKEKAKQVEQTLTAQRDRIDRMFRDDRRMPIDHFNTYYWNHGLMGWISRRIIWRFHKENGETVAALWLEKKGEHANKVSGELRTANCELENWVDSQGENIDVSTATHVSLWHPVLASQEEVRQWRVLLLREEFLQPLKQAYREIYILTDAEVNTRTYSNRMAAHILKQHQFNSLAKGRGWRYGLLGAFDNGGRGLCVLHLRKQGLRAEYWINELPSMDAINETGMYSYVGTDQVRFYREGADQPIILTEVPPLVFSEVMRDVDLFVGVASVGNDPTWGSGGQRADTRDYWSGFSFGELTEIAKTRREILQGLVPRLAIASVAEVRDKFLVVRGKLRTYKIHLGSTNILMEPNDQYLCIVPDRSAKDPTTNLFLPFEGDNGLSIILSKAFLLAEDDKIKDETITRQIVKK